MTPGARPDKLVAATGVRAISARFAAAM